jgi:major vault protein
MPEYTNYPNNNSQNYQRDLTLAPNEYVFVQSRTNGVIKTYTGPYTITISGQESLVIFDSRTKQFKETNDFEGAKQTFVSAPEGWYVSLKNPAAENKHPGAGGGVDSPQLEIGKKINISGPVSFSLFPGQMARVIRGHRLRSNQYLLARVYDADEASKSTATIISADGKETVDTNKYYAGQILVIKGTEVAFYVPPTGIEVIPVDNDTTKGYVREAITLERLEYCILKDENGSKTYCHGPAVVFPKPTETFVSSRSNSYIFRAIELSKISGIYVKVIAEYDDDNGKHHPIGEELFITGEDQMIYYPRPEHAIINYDEKILHHAIAIPEGEGRYIMNRLTGEINTVKGPDMYLPDPRTEVVVKRKLTPSQCELWFPGNQEALAYNTALTEKSVEKGLKAVNLDAVTAYCCTTSMDTTLANLEAKANISRGTSYTKPRTITLDNKYEGVVSMDVWTGYAVNVISKDGSRKVVCGPQTILLDYDQTLEILQMSTGRPKSTDHVIKTVFLRHENNKVSDLIEVETKDFVKATVKVSYCVDFDPAYKDKWFNIENYVKYMTDRQRSIMKREVKKYTIEEFYQNYSTIIRNIAIDADSAADKSDKHASRFFVENGMYVHDCEVLSLQIESNVAKILGNHQTEMISKTLELSTAAARVQVAEALAEAEKKENEVKSQQLINKMELQRAEAVRKAEIAAEMARKKEAEERAQAEATNALQGLVDAAHKAKLAREKAEHDAEIEHKTRLAEIEAAKQATYAATIKEIISGISPDLVASLSTKANADMLIEVSKNISPYALARGESVAGFVNELLKGTTLEDTLKNIHQLTE